MMPLIVTAFGLTAFVYSLVGFAGGSTYLALLVLWGVPHLVIPPLALICNIIVASGNSLRYLRAGLLRTRLLLPHMALAIPCAYLGGRVDISKTEFQWLTAICLLWAALYLLWRHKQYDESAATQPPPLRIAMPAGAVLGFLSGLIGIGGGIFLAPLLYMLKAGTPKEIASTCSMFILVNSLAGLAGQFHKLGDPHALTAYWMLPVAVFIGGQIGSHLTIKLLALRQIALITALVLLAVALRLWWDLLPLHL
jgi:uncharacterized membrane protein YfcA